MAKIKKKNKGFSLFELLAVIVILGIITTTAIVTTTMLIDRAKQNAEDVNKSTLVMAAQSYIQNNKNLVPKNIGESIRIKVSDLRKDNYLTEDIKNSKGESCMQSSYVRVYKLSKSEYIYTAFLYCGNEESPLSDDLPKPIIVGKFTDSSNKAEADKLNNVKDAYLFIEIQAAEEQEILNYKKQKNEIKIDSFSYKISIAKNGIMQEAYNSGNVSANRSESFILSKKLNDYIDIVGITEISLEVTAINTLGGISTINTTITENGETDKINYNDKKVPECVPPEVVYSEDDWVNKQNYVGTKSNRKITVGCNDGTGSGCVRNYYTKSWPNSIDEYGAELAYMEVKDNAGNVSEENEKCKVRVNVDIQTPSATLSAYVGKQSDTNDSDSLGVKTTGSNVLKETISVNDSDSSITIEPTTKYYEKLVGNDTNDKWMNKEKYPNGVIYKIDLKDNIRLDRWTWKTNAGYIDSTSDKKYLKVQENNPEATNGFVPQNAEHGKGDLHGSIEETVYVRFLTEGMRYGVFTAYDKAGNYVEIKIAANLDRTSPPIPENIIAYVYNNVREKGTSPSTNPYAFSTWVNRFVRVEIAEGQDKDDLTNKKTLSGFWKYFYDARNASNIKIGKDDYSTYSSGIGYYDFKGKAKEVDGKNKIRFLSCDRALNCSDYTPYKEVWIDITIPKCTVKKDVIEGKESTFKWLGIGEKAKVTATCDDGIIGVASGCTVDSFHHIYDYQINTTKAGANGNNKGGNFTDHAGNSIDCTAEERIQIDYEAPKCTVSGGNKAWTNDSRTIKGTCSDTGGSNCQNNISHTYNLDIETNVAGAAGNNNGGAIYDKADNIGYCEANQDVYVDKTKPTIEWTPTPGLHKYEGDTLDSKITVTAICKDNLSGFNSGFQTTYQGSYTVPTAESGKTHEKCCIDKAGNTHCEKKTYYAQHYSEHHTCDVKKYKQCRATTCNPEKYKLCRAEQCKAESYNKCQTSGCGVLTYEWTCSSDLAGTRIFKVQSLSHPYGGRGYCGKTKTIYKSCEDKNCGVKLYKLCRHEACGVEIYEICRAKACGVEEYEECYHYK